MDDPSANVMTVPLELPRPRGLAAKKIKLESQIISE